MMFIDAHGNAEANYTMLALLKDTHPHPGFTHSLQPVAHFMTHGSSIPVITNSNVYLISKY